MNYSGNYSLPSLGAGVKNEGGDMVYGVWTYWVLFQSKTSTTSNFGNHYKHFVF